ncbi:MAG: hypothetical protein ACR2OB_06090 [Solirubrobacteraceae bacterium]
MRRTFAQCSIALFAGTLGVGALLPSQAAATFEGRNGLIAWSSVVSNGKAGGAFAITIIPGRGKKQVIRACSDVNSFGDPIYCEAWDRVSFSPDGRQLMWDQTASGGNEQIVLAKPDGSAPQTIDHGSAESDSEPSFSPDGQRIVYVRGQLGAEGQIVTSNLAGGDVQVMTPTVTGFSPVWAPNGRTIVFVHGEDIWSVGVNGQGAKLLIRGGQDPDFSPDGRQIVYLNNGGFVSTFGMIYTARADGTHRRKLPLTKGCCKYVQSVAFSPNGKQLVFGLLSARAKQNLELSTVAMKGGHPKRISSRFTDYNGGFTTGVSWQPRR